MQSTFAEFARKAEITAQNAATKADMDRVQTTMAGLATKAEVDARHRAIDDRLLLLDKRITESTPASILAAAATLLSRLLIVAAFAGLVVAAVHWADRVPLPIIGK